MAVKRRVIWMNDEQWDKLSERAKALRLSRSVYIVKLLEWRQPDAQSPRDPFIEFRPAPKPGRK